MGGGGEGAHPHEVFHASMHMHIALKLSVKL